MTLRGIISEEDYKALPEVVRNDAYTQGEDGRYYADIEPIDGWAFEHIEGLRSSGRKEREQRQTWERKHNTLASQLNGVDPTEIARIDEYKEEIERLKKAPDSEKTQQRIKELERTYENKLQTQQNEHKDMLGQRDAELRILIVDNRARRALEKLGCKDPDLILPHVHGNVNVVRDDTTGGKPNVKVVDKHGDPIPTKKKGAVGDMDLEELCGSYREQWPSAFEGSKAAGGGAPGTGGAGRGNNNSNPNDKKLPPSERLKRYHERNAASKFG